MREKLIEILKQAPFEGQVLDYWWREEKIARIADHLIANGVTIPVRCEGCQQYETKHLNIPGGELNKVYEFGYCYYWKYETGESPNSVEPDDFCSYGERRTDD